MALREAAVAKNCAARHAAALTPMLDKLNESGDALNAPDLTERLSLPVLRVVNLRTAREKASTSLVTLSPRIATAESRVESAETQSRHAGEGTAIRQASVETLQAERAALLDGEATATHRTRHNDARKAQAETASAAHGRAEAAEVGKFRALLAEATAQATLAAALVASDLAALSTPACEAAGHPCSPAPALPRPCALAGCCRHLRPALRH